MRFMSPFATQPADIESLRLWISVERDKAARGTVVTAVALLAFAVVTYAAVAAALVVGLFAWWQDGLLVLGVGIAVAAAVVGLLGMAIRARQRGAIPFADGYIFAGGADVDSERASPVRVMMYWFFGVLPFWVAGLFGRFARWLTLEWIDELRLVRALIRMDTAVAAQFLERGLETKGAAPLIDLECIPGATADTLRALCAIPGVLVRGGSRPGLVVSDDARERMLRDIGVMAN